MAYYVVIHGRDYNQKHMKACAPKAQNYTILDGFTFATNKSLIFFVVVVVVVASSFIDYKIAEICWIIFYQVRFHYVSREIRKRTFTNEGVICANGEGVSLFGSYERYCLRWSPAERRRPLRMARLSFKKPMPICKNKKILLAFFCLWMAYVPFSWVPPILLQILHRRWVI